LVAKRRERGSGPVSAELIEREAVRLFGERSYPVVGMRDIGDAVGILPGSLYVHISSKEEVLLRIVERGIENYLEEIEPIAASDDPPAVRIRLAIRAHMRVLASTLEQTRVAFNQWTYLSEANRKQVVELRERYERAFTTMVRDGVAAGDFRPVGSVRITVLATIGMLNAAAQWYSPGGPMPPEEIGDALADHTLFGLEQRTTAAVRPTRSPRAAGA
jgi:TetR/AcrR family transcriptional regulator, cholesterol catabolism regulator